jgi:hypothetical protein
MDGHMNIAFIICNKFILLQNSVTMAYHLNFIARRNKMTISSTKTKSMAMWGTTYRR